MKYKIEFYKDKKKEYRSRIISRNGKIILDSGEGYKSLKTCRRAIVNFLNCPVTEIILTIKK